MAKLRMVKVIIAFPNGDERIVYVSNIRAWKSAAMKTLPYGTTARFTKAYECTGYFSTGKSL